MGVKGEGWERVDWIHLDQDRDTVMNFKLHKIQGNF
jgi:hypothetical protein